MRVCPECHRQYDDTVQFCIADAAKLLIVGAPEEDPFLNQVIGGKYRVEKKIGEGGMGKIYLGRHVTLGKRFAIKTLHADFTRNTEALERFRREAITTAQLEHPHILGMADMDQMDDGTAYIVMEFLDGKEMRSLLNEVQVLPVPRAVHIFAQVCRALAAAHDKNIVHRDMKPENVFLVEREGDPDFVKVLDFGISKIRMAGSKLTQTGMVIGTPHYMSPEQARGDPSLDHRSDIYTLGAMLYEALTGALPVQAENSTGVLVKILTEEPVRPTALNPQISPPLEGVILRAMAKDPNLRFGTCREMSQALQQATGVAEGSSGYTAVGMAAGAPGIPPTSRGPGVPPTAMRPPTAPRPAGVPPTAMTPPGISGPYAGPQSPPVPGFPSPPAMAGPVPPTSTAPAAGFPSPYPGGVSPVGYPTGPTPMAWQQPGTTGPAPVVAPKSSKLPLFIVLGLVVGGGAFFSIYWFAIRDTGEAPKNVAAPSGADAGIVVKAGSDVGAPGTEVAVAAAEAATVQDTAVAVVEAAAEAAAEAAVAAGPDAGDEAAVAAGPDASPDAGAVASADAAPIDVPPEKVAITFVTSPQGAKAFLVKPDGSEQELCTTPCQWDFDLSESELQVVFRKSNFRDQPASFTPNDDGFINVPLERVQSGRRDAGVRETVTVQVQPDAGAPRRDAPVIVVRPPDGGGPVIRIEAGHGVTQVDAGGPRIRDSNPFGH
ncbi:MAG: protein kinase [Deltaproteobacteria bacterium]|nr:protein kinase [Deltaproteobacteria bacterium]